MGKGPGFKKNTEKPGIPGVSAGNVCGPEWFVSVNTPPGLPGGAVLGVGGQAWNGLMEVPEGFMGSMELNLLDLGGSHTTPKIYCYYDNSPKKHEIHKNLVD